MKTMVHVKGKLVWKWGRTKRGSYVAICDAFAQTVQAEKFGELLESMREAVESTLDELFSTGDLEKFLQERRWTTNVPIRTLKRNVGFDMPFDLKGVPTRDFQEALC